ncbi:MAG: MBL fold metallo-hydrolase [Megasphaera micronuciformis]|nr:MBL fold metallo-hydrolase [Megasphaera micronuciformis]
MTGHKNDLEAYAALVGAARFANKTVSTEPALPVETVTAADCRSSVTVLASGSGGNATLVCCGSTKILIDAGISYRRITNALSARGYRPDDIDALFLTHEHTDHVQGLPILLKNTDMPVYTTEETWRALGKMATSAPGRFVPLTKRVGVGDIYVVPFEIPHDAARPVGYAVYDGQTKITYATDLGYVTPSVRGAASHADILVLEANHDEDMVRQGPYPYRLQQRILGSYGHLSNDAAADLLTQLPQKKMMKVLLAHRSDKNNEPAKVIKTIKSKFERSGKALGQDVLVRLACKNSAVRFDDKGEHDE